MVWTRQGKPCAKNVQVEGGEGDVGTKIVRWVAKEYGRKTLG